MTIDLYYIGQKFQQHLFVDDAGYEHVLPVNNPQELQRHNLHAYCDVSREVVCSRPKPRNAIENIFRIYDVMWHARVAYIAAPNRCAIRCLITQGIIYLTDNYYANFLIHNVQVDDEILIINNPRKIIKIIRPTTLIDLEI